MIISVHDIWQLLASKRRRRGAGARRNENNTVLIDLTNLINVTTFSNSRFEQYRRPWHQPSLPKWYELWKDVLSSSLVRSAFCPLVLSNENWPYKKADLISRLLISVRVLYDWDQPILYHTSGLTLHQWTIQAGSIVLDFMFTILR